MKKAAVIGNPVTHSLSPVLFNYWFKMLSIDANYKALQLESGKLRHFLDDMRRGNYIGCNVTIPFKENILELLDGLEKDASIIGAVNVVLKSKNNKLIGHNTDCLGFLFNLDKSVPNWKNRVSTAMVLGVGGAAKAAVFALLSKGVSVLVVGRDNKMLDSFIKIFNSDYIEPINWKDKETALLRSQLIVNATPLGMVGQKDLEMCLINARNHIIFYDLVYSPLETKFLRNAKAAGHITIEGLGMFIHQAALTFKIWFKKEPPLDKEFYTLLRMKLANTEYS